MGEDQKGQIVMTGKQIFLLTLLFMVYTVGVQKVTYEKYQQRLVWDRMFAREDGYNAGFVDGNNKATETFYDNLTNSPEINRLFLKYFPDPKEARIMRAIAMAESKNSKTVINEFNNNNSIDVGFFQINSIHKNKNETKEHFIDRLCSLDENFKEAKRILDTQGLTSWSTYNNGVYLNYLK